MTQKNRKSVSELHAKWLEKPDYGKAYEDAGAERQDINQEGDAMTNAWTPTDGMRRAALITDELLAAGAACNVIIQGDGHAVYRQRMMEVIAREIDLALVDKESPNNRPAANGTERVRITNPIAAAMLESEGLVPRGTTEQLVKDNAHLATHGVLPPLAPKKKRGPKKGSKRKAKAKAAETTGDAP